MSTVVASTEREVAIQRQMLDAWLEIAYQDAACERFNGELDASYPAWHDIEVFIGAVFDDRHLKKLDDESISSILFFISRNEEVGSLIQWLSPFPGRAFSTCGHLTYEDFSFLAQESLSRDEDFSDYQLATSYRKLAKLDAEAVRTLHRFFERTDSYTRRMALHTLSHFDHPSTAALAVSLWESTDCEFAKLSCLHALKTCSDAQSQFEHLLREYQHAYDVEAEEYRRTQVRQLTE